jgi:uncharacterized RDD family membrane protein YckC
MRCPACGARYKDPSARCPECGALQIETQVELSVQVQSDQLNIVKQTIPRKTSQKKRFSAKRTRSLIEFPGANRNAMPHWRKELGERVREVQEKRAREAVPEAGEIDDLVSEPEPRTAPTLELLPQAEMPAINPLVAAALRRIERAHTQSEGNAATAALCEEEPTLENNSVNDDAAIDEVDAKLERAHNLAVVPPPEVITPEVPQETRKPRRLIADQNDPALNYLDSIPTSVRLERLEYRSAPIVRRMLGAVVDLAMVALFASPILALAELTNLEWQNPRVIGFAVGAFLVVGFVYLTVTVAFTGRTIGMKLFSLRVVDARTGLIPTGSQSAGRSLVYLLSLASAGIALMYAFIDAENHTVHDRFTRTAVIRA